MVFLGTLTGETVTFFKTNTPRGGSPEDTAKAYAPGGGLPYNTIKVYAPIGGFAREPKDTVKAYTWIHGWMDVRNNSKK